LSKIIQKGNLPSVVEIPTSKSYANRALILGALKPQSVMIENISEADDVKFLIAGFEKIGLICHKSTSSVEITNQFPSCENTEECTIEIGEGGTTARFLACMLLLGKSKYHLILGERLKARPWSEFIKIAKSLGAKVELNDGTLSLQGPIAIPEVLEIDCSNTTQFASGFQLVLGLKRTKVVPINLKTSQSYWKMSQEVIESFQKERVYSVPLDWSSASYAMAFAALRHEIFFPKLFRDDSQADSKFLDLLSQFGCVKEEDNGLRVKQIQDKNSDIVFDVSDCLDLVPTLGFFLSHIDGTHKLINVDNLIHKESNRVDEVISVLKKFGFEAYYESNSIIIEGTNLIKSLNLNLELPDDHRIVMMAALFMRYHEGGELSPESAVNKSYPNFFKLFK